jgi:hypothetical protein
MFFKTTAIAKLFAQTPLLGYTFFQKITTSYHGILHEATIKAIKSVHIIQPGIAKYIISFYRKCRETMKGWRHIHIKLYCLCTYKGVSTAKSF